MPAPEITVTIDPVRKFHMRTVPDVSPAARSIVEIAASELTPLDEMLNLTEPFDHVQMKMRPSEATLATVAPSHMAAIELIVPACRVKVVTGVALIVAVFHTLQELSVEPPVMRAPPPEYAIVEIPLPWLVSKEPTAFRVFKLKK